MTEFQDPFLKSAEPVKLNQKYIDSSVRPGDIGIVDQWAVNQFPIHVLGTWRHQLILVISQKHSLIIFRFIELEFLQISVD